MKDWYSVTVANFEAWSKKANIPFKAIKPHLDDTMEKARTLWPDELRNWTMDDSYKNCLISHWKNFIPTLE